MISQLRNSVLLKFLWGVMGLHLLNISVDSAEPDSNHIYEDLTFNDQESIVEIIIEQFLGYEEAFEEYDDHDPEDHNNKTNIKIDLIPRQTCHSISSEILTEAKKQKFPHYNENSSIGFTRLDTPPPKV